MLEKFKVSKFLTFPTSFAILQNNSLHTLLFGFLLGFCRYFVIRTDCWHLNWLLTSQTNSYTHLFWCITNNWVTAVSTESHVRLNSDDKFGWMSKCHLKGTDIEDVRLRVENNPDLISLCDWSRKLMPIDQPITFKIKTNHNWLAFSPEKSCSLFFSLGSLIDCCDYFEFGLMTTNRKAL